MSVGLDLPLVGVADGAGRLSEGGVVLHRHKVGQSRKGGKLLVDAQRHVVVFFAELLVGSKVSF